ncbi:MAG: hypothetical protein WCR27_01930 [Eubacteriales bacterium]
MNLQTVVLLLLGIIFIFFGWRCKNETNEDILTSLKGLAGLKKEIRELKQQIRYVDAKLDQTISVVMENEIQKKQSAKEKIKLTEDKLELNSSNSNIKSNNSKMYKDVILRHGQHMPVPKIAEQLSISQDAVSMIIRTYQRG